ncbi:unnamed protein product [Mytilus coruscus]|uniref:C17orf113 probable zinc finger domain-containing protein n=1 Tax=Mytilus coruscus TaxID=42192 RepID=A0A6J8AWP1_MYTCO|nr:unnamed protein product [Mytilus coruscus]
MNLEKIGFTSSKGCLPANEKPNIDKKTRNKIYDEEQRNRCLVPSCKNIFAWLNYDEVNNLMLCTYCKDYPTLAGHNSFVTGSDAFHIRNIRSHDTSRTHLSCLPRYSTDHAEKGIKAAEAKNEENNASTNTSGKAFQQIVESEKKCPTYLALPTLMEKKGNH